jgi:hypothetical protein
MSVKLRCSLPDFPEKAIVFPRTNSASPGSGHSASGSRSTRRGLFVARLSEPCRSKSTGAVDGIDKDQWKQRVFRGIAALGEGLHLEVIAEGAETEDEARFLMLAGCDAIQLFPPLPGTSGAARNG